MVTTIFVISEETGGREDCSIFYARYLVVAAENLYELHVRLEQALDGGVGPTAQSRSTEIAALLQGPVEAVAEWLRQYGLQVTVPDEVITEVREEL